MRRTSGGYLYLCCGLLLAIASCRAASSDPPAEPEAVQAVIPFLTTRHVEASRTGAVEYSTEVGEVSAGRCEVSLVREKDRDELRVTNGAVTPRPMEEILNDFAGRETEGLLIYIHGYNIGLRRACRDAARLADATGFADRILLFSWPASRAVLTYRRDERRLARSTPAILAAIEAFADRYGHANVNIVAHSMGARVALAIGEDAAVRTSSEELQFDDVILVAPDIDRDRFIVAAPGLRRRAHSLAILVSEDDRLLLLSQLVNQEERLGLESDIVIEGVQVVDVSDMEDLGFSGHIYHLDSHRVGELLGRLLNTSPRE
jgi:esterase/lipase superfamily enzyme